MIILHAGVLISRTETRLAEQLRTTLHSGMFPEIGFAACGGMRINMSYNIKTTEYNISVDLGEESSFAFVPDMHCTAGHDIIRLIKANVPDAILVGGDFINDAHDHRAGFEFLYAAAQICPTFCSIGNHERKFHGDLCGVIEKTHATLLDNDCIMFRGIKIGGLSSGFEQMADQSHYSKTPPPDTAWLNKFSEGDEYKILMSHHPEYYDRYIRQTPVNLVLSGHAHGSQWRLGNMGLFAPGQGFFPKYTSGMYENRLIVSRGIGNTCGLPRVNNEPEIVFIKLK